MPPMPPSTADDHSTPPPTPPATPAPPQAPPDPPPAGPPAVAELLRLIRSDMPIEDAIRAVLAAMDRLSYAELHDLLEAIGLRYRRDHGT